MVYNFYSLILLKNEIDSVKKKSNEMGDGGIFVASMKMRSD